MGPDIRGMHRPASGGNHLASVADDVAVDLPAAADGPTPALRHIAGPCEIGTEEMAEQTVFHASIAGIPGRSHCALLCRKDLHEIAPTPSALFNIIRNFQRC